MGIGVDFKGVGLVGVEYVSIGCNSSTTALPGFNVLADTTPSSLLGCMSL